MEPIWNRPRALVCRPDLILHLWVIIQHSVDDGLVYLPSWVIGHAGQRPRWGSKARAPGKPSWVFAIFYPHFFRCQTLFPLIEL
jgi:hypothetical protein